MWLYLAIRQIAKKLANAASWQTIPFLMRLVKTIHEEFDYQQREDGHPYSPEYFFTKKNGSCRDFTVFAMALCRELGIASRYVSGYFFSESENEPDILHAWMEVYLPGGGWRGYDPTHGLACYNHHIPLCASHLPQETLPVIGSYRGFANSRIKYSLAINQSS